MTDEIVWSSSSKYIFTTRYTDFELDTNRHPEATVTIPAKEGYDIKLLELTVNMASQTSGNTAYCTYLLNIDGVIFNPDIELKTTSTSYTPMKVSMSKQIRTSKDVIVYLHLKSTSSTSKAMVKNFQIKYKYVAKGVNVAPVTPEQDTSDAENLEYILYISGSETDVEAAISELKKEFGDKATVETYSKK
jgi:hypothetical protein